MPDASEPLCRMPDSHSELKAKSDRGRDYPLTPLLPDASESLCRMPDSHSELK
ncbi:MAG: hypothetical protein F6J93_25465 [Oscillatoria sp. SIO1A7]|nr:hypothetical protein [Oscillatoria sp. SIO1A7]